MLVKLFLTYETAPFKNLSIINLLSKLKKILEITIIITASKKK